jgi:hypothetical protein
MVDHDDEALERMRAADPAIGSHPDLSALRRKLSRTTPLGLTGGWQDDRAVPVTDGTTRGSRGSLVAAAAVVALGLGVGGYALGAQTAAPDGGSGADLAGTAPEQPGPVADARPMQESSSSGGGSDMGFGGAADSSMAAMLPTVLRAGSGLSTAGGTGEVRAVQPPDLDEDAFLRSWAAALGLAGEPEGGDDYRSLTDGTVSISIYGGTYPSLDYMDSSLDPWCSDVVVEERSASPEGDVSILPAPEVDCPDDGDATLPDDRALALAKEFLAGVGVPAEAYDLTVEPFGGGRGAYVNGALKDGDLPQQLWANITVVPEGVANANVQLAAELVPMGEYPLVSPVEAVERFSDPRFASWGTVYVPALDGEGWAVPFTEEKWVEPTWPDVDRSAGAPIPFWISEATVVEARIEDGVLSLPSGDEFVVPTYVLTDDQGRHHTMIALADEALDFTP